MIAGAAPWRVDCFAGPVQGRIAWGVTGKISWEQRQNSNYLMSSPNAVGGQSPLSAPQDQTSGNTTAQPAQLPPLTIVELLAIGFLSIAFLHFVTRWGMQLELCSKPLAVSWPC